MRTGIATLILAILVATLTATGARATVTQVDVRIEGQHETLFEGPIWTEGHDVRTSSDTQARSCDGINVNDPENLMPGPTPTAAAADAMSMLGETFDGQWYDTYDDYFITRFGPDEQSLTEAAYWGILVDDVFTDVGGCQYELGAGQEVLWVYDAFKSRPLLALLPASAGYTSGVRPLTATAELGKPFVVEVLDYADQKEDKPPSTPERAGSSPFSGAQVAPVRTNAQGFERVETEDPSTRTTDAQDKASITFTQPGWHRIKATASDTEGQEAIRSNRLDVCVPALGEPSCGAPPAEDEVRLPPAYAGEVREEHDEVPTGAGDGETPAGEQTVSGRRSGGESNGAAPGAAGVTPPVAPVVPPARGGGSRVALVLESITPRRLVLKLTARTTATVELARREGDKRHPHWRVLETIAAAAGKVGRVVVRLPRLRPGRYRVAVTLAGARGLRRTLTVPPR
jgi:hypothetical protein